jgi:hypothetical protein
MARRKTEDHLTRLITDGVQEAMLARLRVAAEREGEDLALGLLRDEEFRQEFLTLAREAARAAVARLRAGGRKGSP